MLTVLFIALTICLITDTCNMKIYNFITLPLICVGILYRISNHDYLFALICFILGIIILSVPNVGGGDKKLLLGILLCLGGFQTLNIIIIAHLLVIAAYFVNNFFFMKFILKEVKSTVKSKTAIAMGPAYTLATIAVAFGYGIPFLG